MYPFLRDGDIIYFKPVKYTDIEDHDILVIKEGEGFYTHRVIYKTDAYIITKGDNSFNADVPVLRDDIMGKVYQIKRGKEMLMLEDLFLMQSTLYHKEILSLNRLLSSNKIPYVILKGLPLHLHYQGRHPKKIYADCDILVDPQYQDKIDVLLKKNGYNKSDEHLLKDDTYSLPEVTYFKVSHGFAISFDIHYKLFLLKQLDLSDSLINSFYLSKLAAQFIKNRRKIVIGSKSIPILAPEDLIVYLCFHFFRHNYRDITRLKLIDLIIRKDIHTHVTWVHIEGLIKTHCLGGYVYPVFVLLIKYFDTPIPSDFMNSLKPRSFLQLFFLKQIEANVFQTQNRLDGGIMRFIYSWIFSSEPVHKKFILFFQKRFFLFLFWTLTKKNNLRNVTKIRRQKKTSV